MTFIKKLNHATLFIILVLVYFPAVGLTYLLLKLTYKEKQPQDTFWIQPSNKNIDFKSPY